jgi:hypothetical protein
MRSLSALRRRRFARLVLALPVVALVAACAQAPLEPASDTRVIGLDLWSGDASLAGVDLPQVRAEKGTRSLNGPTAWAHPKTGKTLHVYERRNVESDGTRIQLFERRADGQALGRVFDSRPGRGDRYFVNDAFFPLGTWSRGESRDFQMVEHSEQGPQPRTATIRIRRLDFTFRDVAHSLRYDWILRDANGTVLYEERFVYSPGVGFASFDDRLK